MSRTYATPFTASGPTNANGGCGFIGMYGLGMHVFFPTFIIEVDTATDCHLRYAPIGRQGRLPDLDYVQPKFQRAKS